MAEASRSISLALGWLGLCLWASPAGSATAPAAAAPKEINIYSAREEIAIWPLIAEFERASGILANVVYVPSGLEARLEKEGKNSPADIVLFADLAQLVAAKEKALLLPLADGSLDGAFGAAGRDPQGAWFAAAFDPRAIVYDKDRVDPAALSTYEDLSLPKWRGRLCLGPATGNDTALVAALIHADGLEATRSWLQGIQANRVADVDSAERLRIRAFANGHCDVTLASAGVLASMSSAPGDPDDVPAARAAGLFWPNQESQGTHRDILGVALAKSTKNHDGAVAFLDFLAGATAQRLIADPINAIPALTSVAPGAHLAAWGAFKADATSPADLATILPDAAKLMAEVGWK
jgi:iron(III) transport system substrate-binding protein